LLLPQQNPLNLKRTLANLMRIQVYEFKLNGSQSKKGDITTQLKRCQIFY